MLARSEKWIITGIICFIVIFILLFSLDLPRELTKTGWRAAILLIYVGFAIYSLMTFVIYADGRGRNRVGMELSGGSSKGTLLMFIDGKLLERYGGEFYNTAGTFRCRRGEHTIMVRYKDKVSSVKIDTSEMKAKLFIRADDTGIVMDVAYTPFVPYAEIPKEERRGNIVTWLILMVTMACFTLVGIGRIV